MTATASTSIDPHVRVAILEVLSTAAGRDVRFTAEPAALRGGFWAELFSFTIADPPAGWPSDLVARLMPDASIAFRETEIQSAVAEHGYATPKIRASGGPDGPFGKAFSVMDRAGGSPLLAGLAGGGAVKALPTIARRIPALLGRAMADLHRLDLATLLDRITDPSSRDDLLGHLKTTAEFVERDDLVLAARWLDEHRPPTDRLVICHGDLHPFNVLEDGDDYAVLDWSAARIAPAEYDIAFTKLMLSEPPLSVPAAARPVIRLIGAMLARRFLRAYAAYGNARIDERLLAWNEGVVCLRALVEVGGWVVRGDVDRHRGHPWLVSGPAFARRLGRLTRVGVRPR